MGEDEEKEKLAAEAEASRAMEDDKKRIAEMLADTEKKKRATAATGSEKEKSPITKTADRLTIPHGIPEDFPDIVDSQGDISHPAFARLINYLRSLADMFEPYRKNGEPSKFVEKVNNAADRDTLESWAALRKSRGEWVEFGRATRSEEPKPLTAKIIPAVPGQDITVPSEEPKKKKKKGRFFGHF